MRWLSHAKTTLVPFRSEASAEPEPETLSREQIAKAFGILTDAWINKRALSHRPETQRDGRYAPAIFSHRLGGSLNIWVEHVSAWLENDCLAVEIYNKGTKSRGLQVINPVV